MIETLVERVAADLREDEGWRPHAYDDLTGKPALAEGYVTLGYGFMVDARKNGRIPREVAEFWLRYEIVQIVERLSKRLPWFETAPTRVQAALVNMAYQMGVAGVLGFRRMLGHLEAGRFTHAKQEALDSRWALQTPSRARKVAAMIGSPHGSSRTS